MKSYPTYRLVFDRRKSASKSKKAHVELEVLFQGKRKWFKTGVSVFSNQWSDKTRVKASMQMVELNERLDIIMAKVTEYINNLIQNNLEFDMLRFEEEVFLRRGKATLTFVEFVEKRINERNDVREGTLKNHSMFLSALIEFGKIKYFSDLTKANIALYDDFLHNRGYKQTTVYGYHKRMMRYINEAMRYELVEKNPYSLIKLDRGKFDGIKYLTKEELDRIVKLNLEDKVLSRTRDLFVFQCFTGLSYSDMVKFDFSKVEKRGKNYFIRDTRLKTDEEYFIMLLSPAIKILKKYDFKLPIISNQQYNLRLKALQVIANIKTVIHTHVARHTFAVMALNMGVSIENLAKMMGHTNIKTTQVYAKVLNTSVQSEFERMQKALEGM